ncbi:MAG: Adenylate kinase [Parcubacteria group bacterium GW2011_GWA2_47_9]|nr:MAG: Adenylate kinase [Parcubacteria group bacterium GW2011_GWA2_47_9]
MKRFNNKLRVIIIFGPPGAGKGTQAELLEERFGLYYLETSKIIEAHVMRAKLGEYVKVGNVKYFLAKEKKLWKTGILCSPPLVSYWVKEKVAELFSEGKGMLMAGSPRTLSEGKDQIPFLKKLYGAANIKVVLLELAPQQTIWRNSHRRLCALLRHPILYNEETAGLRHCPFDGSRLIRREGLDDPQTIKTRLREYTKRTFPLVQYFKSQKLAVQKINGAQSAEDVFNDILKALR